LLAASPITVAEVIAIGGRLRKGTVRIEEVLDENISPAHRGERLDDVVKLIARVRRAERDREEIRDRLDSRTRKLSANKHKELNEQLANIAAKTHRLLRALPLRRTVIERIAERVRQLLEPASKAQREVDALQTRLGTESPVIRRLLRAAEEENRFGIAARTQLRRLGLTDAEIPSIRSFLFSAPRMVRRVEERAGVSTSDLADLYEALVRAAAPSKPERINVVVDPTKTSGVGPARKRGQAYVEDPMVRRAIEVHAMNLASDYYEAQGFMVEDASRTRPFDLHCHRGSEEVRVEVKGTRSEGTEILVTAAEIVNARGDRWRTDLFIVGLIEVTRATDGTLLGRGGAPRVIEGWRPEDSDLIPTQFRYLVPPEISS